MRSKKVIYQIQGIQEKVELDRKAGSRDEAKQMVLEALRHRLGRVDSDFLEENTGYSHFWFVYKHPGEGGSGGGGKHTYDP